MKMRKQYAGAVVPLVTPFTGDGELDEAALALLIEDQVAAGVDGVFVLGTTGEGARVPAAMRERLVTAAVRLAAGRVPVFAGLGDIAAADATQANAFLRAGATTVVAHPPIAEWIPEEGLEGWFRTLLDRLEGQLLLYNIPATTGVSIPLDAVEKLLGHPRLAGIKDSENNAARHAELLRRFGGMPDFAVLIGVGALMEKGLRMGADGIVPSVGNLIPEVCALVCAAARKADWIGVAELQSRMMAVAAVYQGGRSLNDSLSALKVATHLRGLCTPVVLPPLCPVPHQELEEIRGRMDELGLLKKASCQ
jgi:4-hydroxy-tetrahydrodipicolinate synthase